MIRQISHCCIADSADFFLERKFRRSSITPMNCYIQTYTEPLGLQLLWSSNWAFKFPVYPGNLHLYRQYRLQYKISIQGMGWVMGGCEIDSWLSERSEWSHSQFMSIEICGICRYNYYYCTCIVGSKVIAFAASAIFEIIALKTAGK